MRWALVLWVLLGGWVAVQLGGLLDAQGWNGAQALLLKLWLYSLPTLAVAWWIWEMFFRPRNSEFTAKRIRLALTPDEKAVRVWTGDSQEPTYYPYGALLYETRAETNSITKYVNSPGSIHTVPGAYTATVHAPISYSYEKQVPTGYTDLRFSEVLINEFQPDHTLPIRKGSEQSARVDSSVAKAAMRWLNAHRKLIGFNAEASKRKSMKDRETALHVARSACGVKPKKALEAFEWAPRRGALLAGYFAMTEDGQGMLWSERGVENFSLDDLRARWERSGAYDKPSFKVSTPMGDCRVEWTADMGKRVERLTRKR